MTIYIVSNPTQSKTEYFCPDQNTIAQGELFNPNGLFAIGGAQEATTALQNNATAWIAANINLFSVNKDIDVTEGTEWQACDLAAEPPNTDMRYQVFQVINGAYTEAIGLDAAKALLEQTKQNYIAFSGLSTYQTIEKFPKHTVTGLQTL